MRLITRSCVPRSCVLFLWMFTLTLVNSQRCTREQFFNSDRFDSNFDTSDLEATYPVGKQVRVGCNVGYSGFFKLVCTTLGWDFKGSPCQPRSCGHPGDAQFADFHLEKGDDFVFGSQVVFTCHKGYQMVSRSHHRRCMAEGWDGVVPICEAQQCPVIHVEQNVQVIGDPEESTYGNVIQFTCKSRAEILLGSTEMYCDENGEWSGQIPKCKEVMCTVPQIENGYVPGNIPEYKEHDVLHFRCDASYKPTDVRPSKCTKQGIRAEWSPTPACEPIVCRLTLPLLEGTGYEPASKNVFSPGDTLRVSCGRKYWITNARGTSAVVTCKADGEWSSPPICQVVTCRTQRPQHVYQWHIEWGQQITMDETVRYSCRSGYKKTDGATLATCSRNGWEPNPLCQEITCDREHFQNADIDRNVRNRYRNGERVNYICNNGYEGHFTRTCGPTGWTGTERCTRKPCKQLLIENAQITHNVKDTYWFNERVQYACNSDQKVFTVTCEQSGWTGIVDCSACPAANDPHGFGVGQLNASLYYTCTNGYKLSTKGWWAEAKCNNGVWSGLERCIANTACGHVPEVPNGKVTDPRGQSRTAQITCDKGYSAEVTRLNCHEGKWVSIGTSSKTICTPTAVPCNPPPRVDNAVIMDSYQKEYLSDSLATYRCRDKYIVLEHDDTIQCKDGQWEEKNITCKPYCAKLKDALMTFTADRDIYMDGDVIEYQCVVSGVEGNATCNNTEWHKSEECEDITCEVGVMRPPLNVAGIPPEKGKMKIGHKLQFHCDDQFTIDGSKEIECLPTGEWNAAFPTCADITCEVGVMRPPLNVAGIPPEKGQMKIGHKLQFHCDDQFTIDGSQEIECLPTGEWNAAFPTCAEQCRVTGVPDGVNTHVPDHQLRKGQKLRFGCIKRGDTLQGKAEVECLANGQWSDPFPICGDHFGCGKPPSLADGDTTETLKFRYRHGEKVEYHCQNYYIMEGEPHQTCINGEWIGQMRCLKPCTVDREAMGSHNIGFRYVSDDKLYSAHNDHITFGCTRGRHVGTLDMRQRCVDGVIDLPTCQ